MESLKNRASKISYPIEGISSFLESVSAIEGVIKNEDPSYEEIANMINSTGAPIIAS